VDPESHPRAQAGEGGWRVKMWRVCIADDDQPAVKLMEDKGDLVGAVDADAAVEKYADDYYCGEEVHDGDELHLYVAEVVDGIVGQIRAFDAVTCISVEHSAYEVDMPEQAGGA